MGAVGNAIGNTNSTGNRTNTQGSGRHPGGNYAGAASGQGVDMSTTAMGAGEYAGIWQDSPLGVPATYGMILGAAAEAGHEAGGEADEAGMDAAGNSGQEAVLALTGSDVFDNAWHYQVNGYGSAADYIREHCPYPDAIEQIIDMLDGIISDVESG